MQNTVVKLLEKNVARKLHLAPGLTLQSLLVMHTTALKDEETLVAALDLEDAYNRVTYNIHDHDHPHQHEG